MKTKQEIKRYIQTSIEEMTLGQTSADAIQPDQRILEELGLDSLDYASVLLGCEKWMGIKVREDGVDWSRIATVAELAAFLEEQQKA